MPNSPMAWLERAGRAAPRFLLAPGYATTLRASELVSASFGDIGRDEHGDHWLHVLDKGGKLGDVALPPLARTALYVTPTHGNPATPLVASLVSRKIAVSKVRDCGGCCGCCSYWSPTQSRTNGTQRPGSSTAQARVDAYTHESQALARGAELIIVRDLRHASIRQHQRICGTTRYSVLGSSIKCLPHGTYEEQR